MRPKLTWQSASSALVPSCVSNVSHRDLDENFPWPSVPFGRQSRQTEKICQPRGVVDSVPPSELRTYYALHNRDIKVFWGIL